uniref:Ig-like domain-containing protein n=1 Tax=Erpetoichthys calabaricus TaxID=27687 RepID=A0A8C4SLV7_ERPCA
MHILMHRLLQNLSLSILLGVTGQFWVSAPKPEVTAALYSDVLLPCKFSLEKPEHQIKYVAVIWRHKNKQLAACTFERITHSIKVELKKSDLERNNASLLLKNVSIDDEGVYECYVLEAPNEDKGNVRVRVTAAPHISLKPSLVETDVPTTVECSAKNFYPGNITLEWLVDSTPLLNQEHQQLYPNPDGTFNVVIQYNITAGGGQLSCRVNHESLEGRPLEKSLQICKPSLSVSHRTLLRSKKQNVTCKLDGCLFSQVNISWIHNSTTYNESNCKNATECSGTVALMLPHEENELNFTCKAEVEGLNKLVTEDVTFSLEGATMPENKRNRILAFVVAAVVVIVVVLLLFKLCHKSSTAGTERGAISTPDGGNSIRPMQRTIQNESRIERSPLLKSRTGGEATFRKRNATKKGKTKQNHTGQEKYQRKGH